MSEPHVAPDPATEFGGGIPLAKFHRYAVDVEGKAGFGLSGTDGKNNYFLADSDVLASIAHNLAALAVEAKRVKSGAAKGEGPVHFSTSCVATAVPKGGSANGHIQFAFFREDGPTLVTTLTPELSAEIFSSLDDVLSSMANPPKLYKKILLSSKLKGKPHSGSDLVVHFGQTYNRKMLEILGVLIIRANLVEDALVSMLTALLETPRERAEALFYASQNMKARLDMIQAVASKAGLSPGDLQFFADVIKKVESVSRQRNQLVHGEWEFKGDKFSVQERKPLARAGKQQPMASYESIVSLVTQFHDVAVEIGLFVTALATSRRSATKPESLA